MNYLTKELQIGFLVLLCPFILNAQQNAEFETTPPKVSLGIHLGAAFSDVDSDRLAFPFTRTNLAKLERQTNTTARLGVQFLFHINETSGIETGIAYEKVGLTAKGYFDTLSMTVNTFSDSRTAFSYEYITMPILYKKVFNETGKIQISLHAGCYFGYLQTATFGYKSVVVFANPDGSLIENIEDFSFSIKDQTRKTDFGWRVQIGAERKLSDMATLFAYGMYSRGIRRIDDFATTSPGELSDGRHRILGLSIGGFFKMM